MSPFEWLRLHAYNIRKLGFCRWLRAELRNVPLILRLTKNNRVD